MEGICGLISFDHSQSDIGKNIELMAQALSDGESLQYIYLKDAQWAIACSGRQRSDVQPMTYAYRDEDVALVAVGDIYNFNQIAKEMSVDSRNEGKIIAELYLRHNAQWATTIRGNFAIIIIDLKKASAMVATDRFGVRPLVWHRHGNTYFFSSRINSIKRVCPYLEINPQAIYAFIQYEMIPAPLTIYRNVSKLEAGFALAVSHNGHRLNRYWDIDVEPKLTDHIDKIGMSIYEAIHNAVNLMSNGIAKQEELACFLSGGTDSSSICGLLSKIQNHAVHAYSVGFPENGYDEMYYARIAAKAYNLDHHEFYARPENVLDALPVLMSAYDEPYGNSSIIPAYFCAFQAKQNGVAYMLAGDGGDEVFGGNVRYSEQQMFRNYFKIPGLVRTGILEPLLINRLERIPAGVFKRASSYIRRAKIPDAKRIRSYRYVTDDEMFDPSFLKHSRVEPVERIVEDHFERLERADPLDRHLYLDMKMTITDNDLVKVTRMSELAGIRVRYPMLDHPVVELGFRIPVNLKLRRTKELRYIFKHAFRELLPQEVLKKQKHGFGLPIAIWLRNHPQIKQFARELLFDRSHLQRGYFRPGFVEKLWQLQLDDKTPYYGSVVWQLIILECWHKIHWDGHGL